MMSLFPISFLCFTGFLSWLRPCTKGGGSGDQEGRTRTKDQGTGGPGEQEPGRQRTTRAEPETKDQRIRRAEAGAKDEGPNRPEGRGPRDHGTSGPRAKDQARLRDQRSTGPGGQP